MVPAKLCGLWSLISCSNPTFLGSNIVVDYGNVKFTQRLKKYGPFTLQKIMFATVRLTNNTHGKVVWTKRMEYSVESNFFPRVPLPCKLKCPRSNIEYSLDKNDNLLLIKHLKETYVFRRHYVSLENNDHFYKIFMTQLLFDLILRHLPSIRASLEI
jgi:hypothetical protein